MAIQSVVIKVSGVPQPVTFNPTLQAYEATVPIQPNDLYNVEVEAQDFAGNTTTLITFVSLSQGELVKVLVTNALNQPVAGVVVTAHHRNPTGGTNFGRADVQTTASDGTAYLHLNAGDYNIEIAKEGFVSQFVNNLQVVFGTNEFVNTGGTIPETHVLRDNLGAPIEGASIKVLNDALANISAMLAHQKTAADGSWTVQVQPNTVYRFMFEKAGFDLRQGVTQVA